MKRKTEREREREMIRRGYQITVQTAETYRRCGRLACRDTRRRAVAPPPHWAGFVLEWRDEGDLHFSKFSAYFIGWLKLRPSLDPTVLARPNVRRSLKLQESRIGAKFSQIDFALRIISLQLLRKKKCKCIYDILHYAFNQQVIYLSRLKLSKRFFYSDWNKLKFRALL